MSQAINPNDEPYKAPVCLIEPDLSTKVKRNQFKIRIHYFLSMEAYFAVSETKKTDGDTLGELFEEQYLKTCDVSPWLKDKHIKDELKKAIKNKGGNGFRTTKAVKRIMLHWTSLMDPNQKIPSGFTNREAYLIRYCLDKLWASEASKSGPRVPSWEPARCWSAYVLGQYWQHPKMKPNVADEDDIRASSITRKEQRKQERVEKVAQAKKARYDQNTRDASAKTVTANAAMKLVHTKAKGLKMEAAMSILQGKLTDKLDANLAAKLLNDAGKYLHEAFMPSPVATKKKPPQQMPTPDKKPAAKEGSVTTKPLEGTELEFDYDTPEVNRQVEHNTSQDVTTSQERHSEKSNRVELPLGLSEDGTTAQAVAVLEFNEGDKRRPTYEELARYVEQKRMLEKKEKEKSDDTDSSTSLC